MLDSDLEALAQHRRSDLSCGRTVSMLDETVTLRRPEELYRRLAATAVATRRSLEEILLHALGIGSPPARDDAPPEHQVELLSILTLSKEIRRCAR